MSISVLEHTFTGQAASASVRLGSKSNVLIEGGVGTVQLEKSFDGGSNFFVVSRDSAGAAASYTTNSDVAFNGVFEEPEHEGTLYRFRCTAFTSGDINCRISR